MEFHDYFQLLFVLIFYVLFLGRTLILSLKGTRVFVLGKGKNGLNRVLEIGFFVIFVSWTTILVFMALHISISFLPHFLTNELFDHRILNIIGIILNCSGLLIFIAALIAFGTSWRIGIDKKKPDKLVTHGIFSKSRNPIFLFIDLYFIGTWCIYSNLFFLLCAVSVISGIHFQIKKEEEFLLTYYGKEYEEYMLRVRRYI